MFELAEDPKRFRGALEKAGCRDLVDLLTMTRFIIGFKREGSERYRVVAETLRQVRSAGAPVTHVWTSLGGHRFEASGPCDNCGIELALVPHGAAHWLCAPCFDAAEARLVERDTLWDHLLSE